LEHVLAAADPAVEPDFSSILDDFNNLRERTDRRDGAVELPPAMVGDDDRVDAQARGDLRVLGVEDALEDQLAAPELLHPLDVLPGERRIELPGDPLR